MGRGARSSTAQASARRGISHRASRRQGWLAEIIKRDGDGCVWCGRKLSSGHTQATIEHVDPQSAGGDNDLHNMLLACGPCNSARESRDALAWLADCEARGLAADRPAVEAAYVRAGLGPAPLVAGTPFNQVQMRRYCDRLLDANFIKEGDVLALEVGDDSQDPFVREMTDQAARRGALVEVLFSQDMDPVDQIERLVSGDAQFMTVQTYTPAQPVEAVQEPAEAPVEAADVVELAEVADAVEEPAADPWGPYDRKLATNDLRWSMAMWPSRPWAEAVYPDLPSDEAFHRLGQDLLYFTRTADGDSDTAWAEHMDKLKQTSERLTKANARHVHMSGPGTDLYMEILPDARYLPCQWKTTSGQEICVNSPTEEIFTTPDPSTVRGTFSTSRPLVLGEDVLTGIHGRFEGGVMVEIGCDQPEHEAWLREFFVTDSAGQGTNRVGELGLVSQEGRVGQSDRVFFNGIIDENAGTHIGLGANYAVAMDPDAPADALQGNEGSNHKDLILGHAGLSISLTDPQGKQVASIKDGVWGFDEDTVTP